MVIKSSLIIVFYLALISTISAQVTFKKTLGLHPGEPNLAYKVVEHNNQYYIGGNYFDDHIGRWTSFYGIYDLAGQLIDLHTLRQDTMTSNDIGSKILKDSTGLFYIGSSRGLSKMLHYNYAADSVWVSFTFDKIENGITPVDFIFSSDGKKKLFSGGNTRENSSVDGRIVVFSVQDTIIKQYTNPVNSYDERGSALALDSDGNIIVLGNRYHPGASGESFIVKLTDEMELIYSTLDTPDMLDFASRSGFCLDSENNIIIPAASLRDGVVEQLVAKLNPEGQLIWEKPLDYNNFFSNNVGRWFSTIEAHNNDGYIIAGSEAYKLSQDTFIVKAALAKLSTSGDSLWYRTFSFRSGAEVTEQFTDVIKTSDGGYLAVGLSLLRNAPEEKLPWSQSILLKTDADGRVDFTDGTVISIAHSEKIRIRPNPVQDKLYITQDVDTELDIKVFSHQGVLVDSYISSDKGHIIIVDVSRYASGTYQIVARDKRGFVYTSSFVKI